MFRFDQKLTDDIVKIHESKTSYIDEVYYGKNMGEQVDDPSANSYAVKVVALEVGWILDDNRKEGMKFMKSIAMSDRNDLFDLLAIQILIEWLYKKYKTKVVKW